MLSQLFDWIVKITLAIIVLVVIWHVLSNGAYYGSKLGSAIGGGFDFFQALFDSVLV